ncbi:hypothetical protein GCM10023192_40950 [Amycolatopsis samaneae]
MTPSRVTVHSTPTLGQETRDHARTRGPAPPPAGIYPLWTPARLLPPGIPLPPWGATPQTFYRRGTTRTVRDGKWCGVVHNWGPLWTTPVDNLNTRCERP